MPSPPSFNNLPLFKPSLHTCRNLHSDLPSLSSSYVFHPENVLPQLLWPSFQLPPTSFSFLQISAVSSGQTDVGCALLNTLPSPLASCILHCILSSSWFSMNFHRIPATGLPFMSMPLSLDLSLCWPDVTSRIFLAKHPGQQNLEFLQVQLCHLTSLPLLVNTQIWQTSNSYFLVFPFSPL